MRLRSGKQSYISFEVTVLTKRVTFSQESVQITLLYMIFWDGNDRTWCQRRWPRIDASNDGLCGYAFDLAVRLFISLQERKVGRMHTLLFESVRSCLPVTCELLHFRFVSAEGKFGAPTEDT